MKFFIVSCLFLSASALHEKVINAKWAAYKAQHGKEYHPSEDATRLKHFLETTLRIETHNERFYRGEVSYELGHNHLSDLSHEEFKATYLGRERMSHEVLNVTEIAPMAPGVLPLTVDWKKDGRVTSVKNQAPCGSCYAFGVVAVIEALLLNTTRKTYDLSEQQIIDCTFHIKGNRNAGCKGGHEAIVLDYINQNGLVEERQYPYTNGKKGKEGPCKVPPGAKLFAKGLTYTLIEKNENALARAVAQYGPIVAAIAGENRDFKSYKRGVYDNANCPKLPNHIVAVVGYGSKDGKDFWRIKNSWGTGWGKRGFVKIRRGTNQCGIITSSPSAVIL